VSTLNSRFFLIAPLSFLLVLTGCGGGSGSMHVQPAAPIFTSTPGTAAEQDVNYSYQVAATDPSGGSVSFSLTTAPTGAALSGSAVSWTPAAAQSRLANSFTVTATTSEGGTATQSWSLSPTGTVTVSDVATYWTAAGQQQVPLPPSTSIHVSAVVPQSDGSLLVPPGSTTAPGVISIPAVPAGFYWLTIGGPPPTLGGFAAYWTSTSTFDAGRDFAGAPTPILNNQTTTTFAFNLSGLDSTSVQTEVAFNPGVNFFASYLYDPADSPNLTDQFSLGTNIDWSQIKTAFLTQYEPLTLGPLNNFVLGLAATLDNLSWSNGATNTITQTLQPSHQNSITLDVLGSQWAPQFTNAAPYSPIQFSSGLSLLAEPYVTGINAPGVGFGENLTLAGTALQLSGFGFSFQPFGDCDALGFPTIGYNTQPAILTDQNLGALQYGDPFDSSWTRAFSFCQEAIVPIPLPNSGSTVNFALVNSESTAPSNTPLAPLVGPVQAPTIQGASLFTAATLTTTTPMLSWSAPTTGTPIGYRVQPFVATTLPNGIPTYEPAGSYSATQTSITALPLSGGNTYVFAITALMDGAAKIQTSPYRSALPTAYASVVSAPITISAGAASKAIHGDARIVKQFAQPHPAPASSAPAMGR